MSRRDGGGGRGRGRRYKPFRVTDRRRKFTSAEQRAITLRLFDLLEDLYI